MALKYYHAEPLANSLKSMIPLKEKGLAYESHYVDLHKFEQHSEWFVPSWSSTGTWPSGLIATNHSECCSNLCRST